MFVSTETSNFPLKPICVEIQFYLYLFHLQEEVSAFCFNQTGKLKEKESHCIPVNYLTQHVPPTLQVFI